MEQELTDALRYYEQLVPRVYKPRGFPEGFELRPADWALGRDVVRREKVEATIGGRRIRIRPISTLDLEFLSNDTVNLARAGKVDLVKDYPCGLNCPGCFSQDSIYGDRKNLMRWQEVMAVVDDAMAIGLMSAKFLGPGELFQNPDLFSILDAFRERNLPLSIFTKGAELGSDELAARMYSGEGIDSAKSLVRRLSGYGNVRILLGFNSFLRDRQDKAVGSLRRTADYGFGAGVFSQRGVSDYTEKRDRALLNLVEAGFSDPDSGQRLTLVATPISLEQSDEIPSMYLWAALRNIPLIIAPTMESGPRSIGLRNHNSRLDPEHEKLIGMMEGVYRTALENGIMTAEQIIGEGVSAYMGTAPCNQVANGLFVRLNGTVQLCPGRSDESAVYGNVHDRPLAEIWVDSPNYKLGPMGNNWCQAKTEGMPQAVQDAVMGRLGLIRRTSEGRGVEPARSRL